MTAASDIALGGARPAADAEAELHQRVAPAVRHGRVGQRVRLRARVERRAAQKVPLSPSGCRPLGQPWCPPLDIFDHKKLGAYTQGVSLAGC